MSLQEWQKVQILPWSVISLPSSMSRASSGQLVASLSIRPGGFLELAELIDLHAALGERGFDLQLASHDSWKNRARASVPQPRLASNEHARVLGAYLG
jgi:hypothetical protein